MDESLLKAVSQHMNVPEGLISRSAQARAEANGTGIDDVLNAWLGGASVDVKEISPKVQEPIQEEVEQIIEEEVQEDKIEEVIEEVLSPVKEVVQTLIEEVPPPVGLSIKLYKSLKIGLIFGLISGMVQAFIIGNTLFEGVYLDPDSTSVISEYSRNKFVLTIALTSSIFSIFNTVISKKFLDSSYEGFGMETSDRESVLLGVGLGLFFGTLYSVVITNSIGSIVEGVLEGDPSLTYIPVFGALSRICIFSLFTQIFVTSIGQVFGIPKGLVGREREEVVKMRNRINGSFILPIGAILSGGTIAFLISRVFLNFHSYAPLLAIIISAAILLFAGLISSAPNIKVTRTEVWVSLVGVLTLIVVISSIAYVQH